MSEDVSSLFLKTVRLWNHDRSVGKVICVGTLESLLQKAKDKFLIEGAVRIMTADGCEVDDEEGFNGLRHEENLSLFVLRNEESLLLPSTSSNYTENSSATFQSVIHDLRKRKLESKKSMVKKSIQITCGWYNYSRKEKRYINVRSIKGGGTCVLEFPKPVTRDDVLHKLIKQFFPGGRSSLGKLQKYECLVGDSKGYPIADEEIAETKRLNLLTREKIFTIESDDSDLDEFELPAISFKSRRLHSLPVSPVSTTTTTTVTNPKSGSIVIGGSIATNTANTSMVTYPATPQTHQQIPHTITSQMEQQMPHINAGTPTVSFNMISLQCCICMDRERNSFLVPCGHTFCGVCCVAQENGEQGTCSICREPILGVRQIRA